MISGLGLDCDLSPTTGLPNQPTDTMSPLDDCPGKAFQTKQKLLKQLQPKTIQIKTGNNAKVRDAMQGQRDAAGSKGSKERNTLRGP